MKRHRTSDTKTDNKESQQNYRLWTSVMNYWGLKLVLRVQTRPQFFEVVQNI